MVSFAAHDCSSIVISLHMPSNANMVTFRVATATGDVEVSLFGLPKDAVDRLICGLGEPLRTSKKTPQDVMAA